MTKNTEKETKPAYRELHPGPACKALQVTGPGRAGARERGHAGPRDTCSTRWWTRDAASRPGATAIGFLYRVEMMSVWTPWGRMFPGVRVVR